MICLSFVFARDFKDKKKKNEKQLTLGYDSKHNKAGRVKHIMRCICVSSENMEEYHRKAEVLLPP